MARAHNELDHMNNVYRRLSAATVSMVTLLSAGIAIAAENNAKNWDQPIVTGIAKLLAESVVGLRPSIGRT